MGLVALLRACGCLPRVRRLSGVADRHLAEGVLLFEYEEEGTAGAMIRRVRPTSYNLGYWKYYGLLGWLLCRLGRHEMWHDLGHTGQADLRKRCGRRRCGRTWGWYEEVS